MDEALSQAQVAYVNGNWNQAIWIALPLTKLSPDRAWRIIGSAACSSKDLDRAYQAYRHLDSSSRRGIALICQRNGIDLDGEGRQDANH